MGWKTITGAIVTAVGYVSRPEVLALLPQRWAAIVTAVGGVLTAVGLRHAVAKAAANGR